MNIFVGGSSPGWVNKQRATVLIGSTNFYVQLPGDRFVSIYIRERIRTPKRININKTIGIY